MATRKKYPSWQRRHEGVFQYVTTNPCATVGEIASATGYSRWQISRICCSPEFQRRLSEWARVQLDMVVNHGYVTRREVIDLIHRVCL